MQYGNCFLQWGESLDCEGLNRTMQYGNFFSLRGNCAHTRFKSYYVVWKPEKTYASSNLFNWFKSYYVVWKPRRLDMRYFGILRFKSYYVVWKPENRRTVVRLTFGLNRTMQYGNLFMCWMSLRDILSLNRTMQYGNKKDVNDVCGIILFKSYYVVWKRKPGGTFFLEGRKV